MRDIAAVVEPAFDIERITREVHEAHIALRDAESKASRSEERATLDKKAADERRLELGRLLVEARTQFPAKGPKAKAWGDFLARQGIEERSAQRWMQLADYVDEVSDSDVAESDTSIPTQRQVAARKAKRDEQPDPPHLEIVPSRESTDAAKPKPPLDVNRKLSKIQDEACELAERAPSARKQIAHELRECARLIEEMK